MRRALILMYFYYGKIKIGLGFFLNIEETGFFSHISLRK